MGRPRPAPRLGVADGLYVYGPPDGPMTEQTPQRAQGKKGRTRIAMADAVLGAHADEGGATSRPRFPFRTSHPSARWKG
jgi:hypothetical protein